MNSSMRVDVHYRSAIDSLSYVYILVTSKDKNIGRESVGTRRICPCCECIGVGNLISGRHTHVFRSDSINLVWTNKIAYTSPAHTFSNPNKSQSSPNTIRSVFVNQNVKVNRGNNNYRPKLFYKGAIKSSFLLKL